jgi:hypothetical protein
MAMAMVAVVNGAKDVNNLLKSVESVNRFVSLSGLSVSLISPPLLSDLAKVVRGFSFFCALCGHGGHPNHLKRWFEQSSECPAGCGCQCGESLSGSSLQDATFPLPGTEPNSLFK